MSTINVRRILGLLSAGCLIATAGSTLAAPKGAKAIFDSGTGGTIGLSAGARAAATTPVPAATARTPALAVDAAPAADRYVGISYQLLAIEEDGQMRAVSKNRVFRSGERVKILARTNQPGYLTVANIGSTGRMHILYSQYVDASRLTEIPPNSNLRFDANPGTEKILIMLSNEPSPLAPPSSANQAAMAPAPMTPMPVAPAPMAPAPMAMPTPAPYTPAPLPGAVEPPPTIMSDAGAPPIYPPMPFGEASAALIASLEGAKSLTAKGAKDLMVEDSMQSSYAVVSSRQGFKAVRGSAKDLIVESSADGMNYGVVPVAAVSGGGILTLEIQLKHR